MPPGWSRDDSAFTNHDDDDGRNVTLSETGGNQARPVRRSPERAGAASIVVATVMAETELPGEGTAPSRL